jgi:transcriptional regulator with XRE-family HTH domain
VLGGVLPKVDDRSGPPVPPTDERPQIGARLKRARQAQRKTLSEVAEASGVTKGFLSRMERDQANASVAALVRVCQSLGIGVGSLFETAPYGEVVRQGAYRPISFGGESLTEFLLTPVGERRVQAIFSDIEPGGGSGGETYALSADVEFVFVLQGRLEIRFADQVTCLGPGDAFTFAPSLGHSFRSIEERAATRVLWVIAPALDNRSGP